MEMKIQGSQVLYDLWDNALLDQSGKELTLGNAIVNAILGQYESEGVLSGDTKVRRYELAKRFVKKARVEVTIEELAEIKSLVILGYTTLGAGVIIELLENADSEKEPIDGSVHV